MANIKERNQYNIRRMKSEYLAWVRQCDWDIALTLHVPHRMRVTQNGFGADWLETQVNTYFNKLRLPVYPHLPKRQRPCLFRFVVLENSDGVGWHVHALAATPKHIAQGDLIAIMRATWHKHIQEYISGDFEDRLFLAEPHQGKFDQYILKYAIEINDFTIMPRKGYICLNNTAFPEKAG